MPLIKILLKLPRTKLWQTLEMKMINREIKHNVCEERSFSVVFIFPFRQLSKAILSIAYLSETARICLLNVVITKLYMVESEGAIRY